MPKNHAKAIKGMSIACIALAGVMMLLCLCGMALMSVLGPILQEEMANSYYDYGMLDDLYGYGYGYDSIFGMLGSSIPLADSHHGLSSGMGSYGYGYGDDYATYQLAISMLNVLLVVGLIAQAVVLAAGIICLKNGNKPEKFGMVFAWSIVGAVIGFISSGVVQGVLFIIIAVFVHSDRKLARAGMYFAEGTAPAYGAYAQPGYPGAPVPPVAGQQYDPATGQPYAPSAGQAAPPVPPAPEREVQSTEPIVPVVAGNITYPGPNDPIVDGMPPVEPFTQPPAPAGAEGASEQQTEAVAIEEAPVVIDSGAVISIEPASAQASSHESAPIPEATPSATPETLEAVAEAVEVVDSEPQEPSDDDARA